jgi:hypothetical protein
LKMMRRFVLGKLTADDPVLAMVAKLLLKDS